MDVCWGRWDDEYHYITDTDPKNIIWPGKDYFNPLLQGTDDVEHPFIDNIDRYQIPRMAWHDAHVELDGWAARDISNNFIERWNLHREDIINSELNISTRKKLEEKLPIIFMKTDPPSNRIHSLAPRIHHNNVKQIPKKVNGKDQYEDYNTCIVQNLRSLTRWSGMNKFCVICF